MQPDKPIRQTLRKTKGSSATVYGAISSNQQGLKWYVTKESSNSVNFWFFLKRFVINWPRNPQRTVIVMDNASWHQGWAEWYNGTGRDAVLIRRENISKLIEDAGINVLFIPPYSSELNSIGRYPGHPSSQIPDFLIST